ncbi:MAG: hypothetical protein IPM81_02095 [Saprospirales bacterium]|nr:hypothetical protein [Saprospirales bacterium]
MNKSLMLHSAMLALHHTTVLGRGVSLLQDAIRQDKAQTLLLSGDKGPVYLMALPFQGDRPNLIRQTEGFSSGLAHHIEQVFSQAQSSGKAATPLVFVAFFYKISKQKGAVYVGCRDTGTWLLPRSLLSNAEIARYPNALSNYRQII